MLLNTEHFDLQKWFTRRKKGRAFLFCFFVVVFFSLLTVAVPRLVIFVSFRVWLPSFQRPVILFVCFSFFFLSRTNGTVVTELLYRVSVRSKRFHFRIDCFDRGLPAPTDEAANERVGPRNEPGDALLAFRLF